MAPGRPDGDLKSVSAAFVGDCSGIFAIAYRRVREWGGKECKLFPDVDRRGVFAKKEKMKQVFVSSMKRRRERQIIQTMITLLTFELYYKG